MKDERITHLRKSLEDVIDSLEATLRLARSDETDAPETVRASAARLLARLGAADKIASTRLHGSMIDATRADVFVQAMRRLEAAYVAYRRELSGPPEQRERLLAALQAEIEAAKVNLRQSG